MLPSINHLSGLTFFLNLSTILWLTSIAQFYIVRLRKPKGRSSSSAPSLTWRSIWPKRERKSAWSVSPGLLVTSMSLPNLKSILLFVFVGAFFLYFSVIPLFNLVQYQRNRPQTPKNLATATSFTNQQWCLREGYTRYTTNAPSCWALYHIWVSRTDTLFLLRI